MNISSKGFPKIGSLLLAAAFAVVQGSGHAQSVFSDNFDSYKIDTFPSSGGWQLIYNGAASGSQYVDNAEYVSAPNSLRLEGSECWSANAYHPVTFPSSFATVQGWVYIESIPSGGCTTTTAYLAPENPSVGTWGTTYGGVFFDNDGKIHTNGTIGATGDQILTSYSAGKWYRVRMDIDFSHNVMDVLVDGVKYGSRLAVGNPTSPTGIELTAGHGSSPGNQVSRFDNIQVSALAAPTANFTYSTSKANTLSLTFTDASTGSPTSWSWNFGDGKTSASENPAHTYAAPGIYTITLTSSNLAGSSAPVSKIVTVSPNPPDLNTSVALFQLDDTTNTAYADIWISNAGANPSGPLSLAFYLSDDGVTPDATAFQTISVSSLNKGGSAEVPMYQEFSNSIFGKYILVFVDSGTAAIGNNVIQIGVRSVSPASVK